MKKKKKVLMVASVSAGVAIVGALARRPRRYGGFKLKRSIIIQRPSRFLGDIPRELVQEWNLRPFDPYRR